MKKLENLFKDFTQEKRKKQRFLFLFEPTKVVWRIIMEQINLGVLRCLHKTATRAENIERFE